MTKLITLALALTFVLAPMSPHLVARQHAATGKNQTSTATTKIRTPGQGSPERRAVLDAVRARLGIKSRFQVTHLMSDGRTAFFQGGEVVEAAGELQETDLSVLVLLERTGAEKGWKVVDLWTLHMTGEREYTDFLARLRRRVKTGMLARELLPMGLLER